MTKQQVIRVLLVENNLPDAELVTDYLSEGRCDETYDITNVARLAEGLERLSRDAFDVVLIHLRIPDGPATEGVERIRQRAGDVPILLLTGRSDEQLALDAIEAGAQDYLLKNELSSLSLRRSVGYAMSRKREAELREVREALESYGRLASDRSTTSVTAMTMGVGPVKQRAPAHFAAYVDRYAGLLNAYVRSVQTDTTKPREDMEMLVTHLGDLSAGPRDMIDVHKSALDELAGSGALRADSGLVIEGRLFALEMMGILVDFYRIDQQRRRQETIV